MELHTTSSEEEINAQQAMAELQNQLSPRKPSHMSLTSYVLSPTEPEQPPSRCPTSKECGQIIMKLKNEVWDLKCRLHAEKNDKKNQNTSVGGPGVATLSAASVHELTREFQTMKDVRETSERKIQDLENKNKRLREKMESGQQREEILQRRNQELINKLDILDHELALANLRKTQDDCLIDINKSLMTFQLDEDFPSLPTLVPELPPDPQQQSPSALAAEEHQKQLEEFEEAVRELKEKLDTASERHGKEVAVLEEVVKELKEKLDIATEDVITKSQLIQSLEVLLKDKNELMGQGDQEAAKSKEKIVQMTEALKEMGFRHAEEQTIHNNLKSKYRELLEEYESEHSALEQMKRDLAVTSKRDRRTDDLSPDLGIESGFEMPAKEKENVLKATKDNSAEEQIRSLKAQNKDLANKLRQTKLALDKTLERLGKTTAEKEQVEKAVCRQLHRTHGILRAARKNLENPSEPAVPLHQDHDGVDGF